MRRRPKPSEYLETQELDLQAENEFLRKELRAAFNLPGLPRPKRVPATYQRRSGAFRKHFVIPDTQVKPGVPTEHLTWAGKYIVEHADPGDVVIHLGDHWDMSSLSSYDYGKKCFEGRRYKTDVESGNVALALLTKELSRAKKLELHLLRGNHEDRITRLIEDEPRFEGVVTMDDLESPGWAVHAFLEPVVIDGVLYTHYTYNPKTSHPWSGMCSTILKNVGQSFVQGHRQGLDTATQQLPSGGRRRGVICGSFYQHDEDYMGPQGNNYWRGMLMLVEVQDGDFGIVEVSLDYLRRRYSS